MPKVTAILAAIEQGDSHAASQLLPLVYDELRKLAAAQLAHEKPGYTLDATALVHEAYLRLVVNPGYKASPRRKSEELHFDGQAHFFAAAAEAMRRILIERARHKKRLRHGGDRKRVGLADQQAPDADDKLLALDVALTRLAREDEIAARVVEMHHFAGLCHEQVAAALGLTVYKARQKWTFARAWLRDELDKGS